MKYHDHELAAQAAADERAWRQRAIRRIDELTSRVPAKILTGAGIERVSEWKKHAAAARKLIDQRAPSTKSLRTLLAMLEQYE